MNRNVGDPVISSDVFRKRIPDYQPQARRAIRSPTGESEIASGTEVSPGEGIQSTARRASGSRSAP